MIQLFDTLFRKVNKLELTGSLALLLPLPLPFDALGWVFLVVVAWEPTVPEFDASLTCQNMEKKYVF